MKDPRRQLGKQELRTEQEKKIKEKIKNNSNCLLHLNFSIWKKKSTRLESNNKKKNVQKRQLI